MFGEIKKSGGLKQDQIRPANSEMTKDQTEEAQRKTRGKVLPSFTTTMGSSYLRFV